MNNRFSEPGPKRPCRKKEGAHGGTMRSNVVPLAGKTLLAETPVRFADELRRRHSQRVCGTGTGQSGHGMWGGHPWPSSNGLGTI